MSKRQTENFAPPLAAQSPGQVREELVRQNKMGNMAVGPLLINVSLPIVLSMLVQALYNVVDSIFVARLSEDALAAVGLIFPVQNLMIGVAVGTGIGVNSLLSRLLGEGNVKDANRAALNGLFLAVVSWGCFAVLGFAATAPFVSAFAVPGSPIGQMAGSYMRIVSIGSLALFVGIMLERLLQSTGRSILSMASQMTGAVVNIVLDPIMIFGLAGFPAMGVAGAALATVVGQFAALGVSLWLNVTRNKEISFKLRGFHPHAGTLKNIYRVGMPGIIMQSIGSVMTFFMNSILVSFGTTPVSVFSAYFKLQSFVFMPVFGFNSGMISIIAFNFGAKKRARIEQTIGMGVVIGLSVMAAGTLLFWLLPRQMLLLFDAGDAMLEIGVPALRIISMAFLPASVSIIFTGVFQGLGKGMYSMWMSAVRQLLFLLPLAFILARTLGMPALWAAFPIAEGVCLVMAVLFFVRVWRRDIRAL